MTLQMDLTIRQGANFQFIVQVNGGPASIVGYTAEMQIRRTFDVDPEVTLTTGDGLTIDPDARQITIDIPALTTAGLSWPYPARYDLEMTSDDGETVWRVMEGTVRLSREVTR